MADRLLDSQDVVLVASQNELKVSGKPGFDNAMLLAEAGMGWLKTLTSQSISIDVTDVETANSGVLCVLLEWLRYTRQKGIRIDAIHLSSHLRELVNVSGLKAVPELSQSV